MARSRAVTFWMPVMSAILDIYLIFDIIITVFCGSSIFMIIWGDGGNPVVNRIIDIIPADPFWFWVASAGVLAFMCVLAFVLIWVSFYSYRSIKMERLMA